MITKKFTFDAAHKLNNYKGKCKNLHGHTYILFITIKGGINKKSGMVEDFNIIKKIVEKNILNILDHSLINDHIEQPTAENIVIWIWKNLEYKLNLYKIEIWETPDSFVTYYGEND